MTDAQLIEALKSDGPEGPRFQRASMYLYQKYAGYMRSGRKKHPFLSEDDLTDAYHEALNALIRQIIRGSFDAEKAKLSTLLFSIFSNKCIDRLRWATNHQNSWAARLGELSPDLPLSSRAFIEELMEKEAMEEVGAELEQLGAPCRELILAMDYWGYSPEEVARRYEYKDGKSASQAKYRCLQQLRKRLKRKGISH